MDLVVDIMKENLSMVGEDNGLPVVLKTDSLFIMQKIWSRRDTYHLMGENRLVNYVFKNKLSVWHRPKNFEKLMDAMNYSHYHVVSNRLAF